MISPPSDVEQPVPGYARNDQTRPALAFDGTNYLAVWSDSRAIDEVYGKVVGARVTKAGVVLDPGGIELFSGNMGSPSPALVFDGTNYLVALIDTNGSVQINRVSTDGRALDGPRGKKVGSTLNSVQELALAVGKSACLVVWPTGSISNLLQGILVDKNAAAVGSAFYVTKQAGDQLGPRVDFDGTQFFVVWSQGNLGRYDVYGVRVTEAGAVVDSSPIAIGTGPNQVAHASLAFDGSQHLVSWVTSSTTVYGQEQIMAARVSTSGTVFDPGGLFLSLSGWDTLDPWVAFDGTDFSVVWSDGQNSIADIYANRVSTDGVVRDGTGVAVSMADGDQVRPMLACQSGDCLAVWEDRRGGDPDIFGARLRAGTVLEPAGIGVSHAATEESKPSIAFRDGTYLVVWEERFDDTGWDVIGTRVDANGVVLDPQGIAIARAPRDQRIPRVAASESGYLVVWNESRTVNGTTGDYQIFAARVDGAGKVLDPGGFNLISDPSHAQADESPVVASDGTGYLVVWVDDSGGTDKEKVRGCRVDAQGTVLDSPAFAVAAGGYMTVPAITYGGGQYFVAWQTTTTGSGTQIWGARVSPAGAALDGASGLLLGDGDFPGVGYDGSSFVLAARRSQQAFAIRVGADGKAVDSSWIQLGTGKMSKYGSAWFRLGPEVAFDGVDTLVVWPSEIGAKQVFGAWLSPAGKAVSAITLVSSSTGAIHSPAVACSGDGRRSLLAYTFGDQSPGIGAYRVKASVLTAVSRGLTCQLDVECKSGHCVDGVCCDSACSSGPGDCFACSVAAGASENGQCAPLTGTTCDGIGVCNAGACVGGYDAGPPDGGAGGTSGAGGTRGGGGASGSGGSGGAGGTRGQGSAGDARMDGAGGRADVGSASDVGQPVLDGATADTRGMADGPLPDVATSNPDGAAPTGSGGAVGAGGTTTAKSDARTGTGGGQGSGGAAGAQGMGGSAPVGAGGRLGGDAAVGATSSSGCSCSLGKRPGQVVPGVLILSAAVALRLRRRWTKSWLSKTSTTSDVVDELRSPPYFS